MQIFKISNFNKKIVLFIGVSALLVIGVHLKFQKSVNAPSDIFDTIWAVGDPVAVEREFNNLLGQKEVMQNMSIYLQALSQLALAQALQKKFDIAHATLNKAEEFLTHDYTIAHVRILLERGRVFQQSGDIAQARCYFEQAYAKSIELGLDYHTLDAAHMIAIIVPLQDEKIAWNERAVAFALQSKNKCAQEWLGSLYNNLGQNYLETRQFEKALSAFSKAVEYRKKEGYIPNLRFANWAVARALRSLNRIDEALAIQNMLLEEYDRLAKSDAIDMPLEMFKLTRGWIYEELAELYAVKVRMLAGFAFSDLSNNVIFQEVEPQRIQRLDELRKLSLS